MSQNSLAMDTQTSPGNTFSRSSLEVVSMRGQKTQVLKKLETELVRFPQMMKQAQGQAIIKRA
jgi:hypothetical protein